MYHHEDTGKRPRMGFLFGCLVSVAIFGVPALSQENSSGIPSPTEKTVPASDVPVAGVMDVKYVNGNLSIIAEKADLKKLLEEIGRESSIDISVDSSIEGRISVSIVDVALDVALGRILDAIGEKNLAIEYEKQEETAAGASIRKVYIVRKVGMSPNSLESETKGTNLHEEQDNVIEYSSKSGFLRLSVKNIEISELFARIEDAVERTGRHYSIELSDPIQARITVYQDEDAVETILNKIILSLGVGKYKTEFSYSLIEKRLGKPKGVIYSISRRTKDEERQFIKVLNDHKSKGIMEYESGHLREAEEEFAQARLLDPLYAEGMVYIGKIYMQRMLFDRAIKYFLMSIDAEPSRTEALYELGMAYQAKGDYDNAVKYLEHYISVGIEVEKVKIARSALDRYMTVERKEYVARVKEAKKAMESREYQKAERGLLELIDKYPSETELYYSLGEVYFGVGKMTDVVEVIGKLVELYPQEPHHRMALCSIQLYLKQYEKSNACFTKVLELHSDSDLKRMAKGKLAEIEKLRIEGVWSSEEGK